MTHGWALLHVLHVLQWLHGQALKEGKARQGRRPPCVGSPGGQVGGRRQRLVNRRSVCCCCCCCCCLWKPAAAAMPAADAPGVRAVRCVPTARLYCRLSLPRPPTPPAAAPGLGAATAPLRHRGAGKCDWHMPAPAPPLRASAEGSSQRAALAPACMPLAASAVFGGGGHS